MASGVRAALVTQRSFALKFKLCKLLKGLVPRGGPIRRERIRTNLAQNGYKGIPLSVCDLTRDLDQLLRPGQLAEAEEEGIPGILYLECFSL